MTQPRLDAHLAACGRRHIAASVHQALVTVEPADTGRFMRWLIACEADGGYP